MSRPKVLLLRPDYPQKCVDMLIEKCDVEANPDPSPIPRDKLLKMIVGKDGLLCSANDMIDKEVLDAAGPNLKVISTISVGCDHLDLEEIKKRKILVGHTPGVLTDATAELTVALLLATTRRLFEAHAEILNEGWSEIAWSPLWMLGWSLLNKTVGIFGLGRIGSAVARRLQGFGLKRIIYTGPKPREEAKEVGAEFVDFDTLLRESDFICVTCTLNDQTREIFDEAAFSKMKSSAIIVNTARGGVIKQEVLVQALRTNQIRAAGLDTMTPDPLPPDHPLHTFPNCIVLPHIGTNETQTRETMTTLASANLLAGLEGTPMPAQLR